MNFEEWYEANKEALTQCSIVYALKLAFTAGFEKGFDGGYECRPKSEN